MKRHPSLEPLSRDHNDGLILARSLMEKGLAALASFREAWDDELGDHFAEEERLLLPLCSAEDGARLVQEHRALGELGRVAASEEEARGLGEMLHAHIRWEERELFPAIEKSADPAELQALAAELEPLEDRRGQANARRKMLVARRSGRDRGQGTGER